MGGARHPSECSLHGRVTPQAAQPCKVHGDVLRASPGIESELLVGTARGGAVEGGVVRACQQQLLVMGRSRRQPTDHDDHASSQATASEPEQPAMNKRQPTVVGGVRTEGGGRVDRALEE